MIETLRPFIVTSWYGHRNDAQVPAPVREVWDGKFRRGRIDRQQSNVDLAVLDPEGRVVHSFDGFRRQRPRQSRGPAESLAAYTAREIEKAIGRLDRKPPRSRRHALKLPDLEKGAGVRVFVRLLDDRMRAYRAPVVEVVPLTAAHWKPLAYPQKKRSVPAAKLKRWLSEVYPPGIMERVDPRTKKAYRISKVSGDLTLAPAGSDGDRDFATLRGRIRLTDEGPDEFSFEGALDVVLSYEESRTGAPTLRGVFEGIYPRHDRRHDRTREIPLRAAFESRPR